MTSFMAVIQMLIMPLYFISGAMFPVTGLPTWLAVLNRIDPLTYAVDPIRRDRLLTSEDQPTCARETPRIRG